MEIIKNVKSLDRTSLLTAQTDYSISGVYIQKRIINGREEELFEVISNRDFKTNRLLFIDHPSLYNSGFNNEEFLMELLQRVPNLVLSCNELGLLFELKSKIQEYNKTLKIANKRLCKGVDFYMYPRAFQSDNMVNDIVNRANKGIKIMLNNNNFAHGSDSKLREINSRLNASARVLVYTNNPRCVKYDLN